MYYYNQNNFRGNSNYIHNMYHQILMLDNNNACSFSKQDQITPLLIAYAATGAVLSFFELLGVVLACNLATVMKEQNAEKQRMATITQLKVSNNNNLC